MFAAANSRHAAVLGHDDVLDFEQRLGFVQHEEKARECQIAPFLLKLQEHRRELLLMCELHALGHNDWTSARQILARGSWTRGESTDVPPLLTQGVLQRLPVTLSEWKEALVRESKDSRLLCFFSAATAQQIAGMIERRESYGLALATCPVFLSTPQNFQRLLNACHKTVLAGQPPLQWPARVAEFLKRVVSMDRAPSMRSPGGSSTQPAGCLRYTAAPTNTALLRLVLAIFGHELPAPHQILWCDAQTTDRDLRAFIDRTRHNPIQPFVLLQVDRMADTQQHTLLRVFFDARGKRPSFTLHCVETGPSVLQAATYVTPRSAEDMYPLAGLSLDDKSKFRSTVVDGNCIEDIVSFCGAAGVGKTYQIRKRLKFLPADVGQVSLSITEAFHLGEVCRKLHAAALENAGKQLAVCFYINLGKFKHDEVGDWDDLMERIDRLFFDLLVLRSVRDPSSGHSFNVAPTSKLRVYVEIPDRSGHLEMSEQPNAPTGSPWWIDQLPVLAAASKFEDASTAQFDIDPGSEAGHVSKYLKAYEDGSINTLYSAASGPKDVVFVLDDSGSMGSGRLDTCKRCMESDIFATRMQPQDNAGYAVLNSTGLNVALTAWAEGGARIRSNLDATRAGGGTQLWTAVLGALRSLRSSQQKNKWIVALTDGESNANDRSTLRSELRTEGSRGVRVIFITVRPRSHHARPLHALTRLASAS